MFKKKQIAVVVAHACAAAALAAAGQVAAQESSQRVEVVGSNIKRAAIEGALPVDIITKEEISKTGVSSIQELLRTLTISGGQSFETGGSGSFVSGASATGLRGLPATDTLVLLNGRRVAAYGKSQQSSAGGATAFVDLNSLPLAAVEQVQILKDGASAIYGADAIAGVINIVTKTNYNGAEVNVGIGQFSEGDGDEQKINATLGFGDLDKDRYNVMFMVEARGQDAVAFEDRDFSKTFDFRKKKTYLGDYRSSYSDFSNWSPDASGYGAGANCPTANLRGGLCRYDFGPVEEAQPETDTLTGMLNATFKINDKLSAFANLAYNRNETTSVSRAPAMQTDQDFTQVDAARGLAIGTTGTAIATALANQYNALGGDPLGLGAGLTTLDMRTRFTTFGPRNDEITTDFLRYVVGLKGTFGTNWDWEAAYTDSSSETDTKAKNEINKALLADLFVAGAVTNLFTNPTQKGGYDSARYVGKDTIESTMKLWDFKVSGELAQLAAGPLMGAFGAEYREEEMKSSVDPVTNAGLKLGSASVSTTGDRDLSSAYGELIVPITKELEAQLAVRYDDYSDFGSTTNPKVALRYQPTKETLFRASYSTAFKAPTLFQLYEGQAAGGYEELVDTPRCDVTGLAADCDTRLTETRSGGVQSLGLSLDPEESKNYNFGFVWSPTSNFNIAADYWMIHKEQAIVLADAQSLIDENSPAVLRNPTVGGVPGQIIRVTNTYFNANKQEIEGLDVDLNAKTKLDVGGTLSGGLAVSYLFKFIQEDASGDELDLRNDYVFWAVPRYKVQIRGGYEIGPWDITAYWNYTPSYDFEGVPGGGAAETQKIADNYQTTDLNLTYSGFKNIVVSGGVRNAFDEDPVALQFGGGLATDTSMYDVRGRFFYANLNYKF